MVKTLTYGDICKQMGCIGGEESFFTSLNMQFATITDVKARNFCSSLFFIVWCVKGSMKLLVDFKEYTLEPNMALVIRPNMTISIVECQGFMARSVFFNPAKKKELAISSGNMADFYLAVIRQPVVRLEESECVRLRMMIKLASVPWVLQTDFSKLAIHHWVMAFVFSLFSTIADRIGRRKRADGPVNRSEQIFVRFILLCNENFKEQRMVKWYADKMCMTPKYLSTAISQYSGKTANQWINELVIQEICCRLRFTDDNVQEIANDLNFSNPSFFGKYFKHYVGCSPSEYRHCCLIF